MIKSFQNLENIINNDNLENVILYTGNYSRLQGPESFSDYSIAKESSPINYSGILQIWNFTLDNQPSEYIYYFGFVSQRLNSYGTTPKNTSILNEEIFLTITISDVVIGSLNGKVTYPDAGTGITSSEGYAIYPVYISDGILKKVKKIRIDFFNNLTRKVILYG